MCFHVAAFSDSNKFDMQHDHNQKILNFDPIPYVFLFFFFGGGGG